MTTTTVLAAIINSLGGNIPARRTLNPFIVEAAPAWFPKPDSKGIQPWDAQNEGGEAQAIILSDGKRYCISLEELP